MRRAVTILARLMALLGGIVLTALVVMTCISVIGKGLNDIATSDWLEGALPAVATWLSDLDFGPIRGDYEITEAGIAFAVFAFLPICQLSSSHATVDVFTDLMPRGINRFLIAFWEAMLALAIVVIAWRLFVGMEEKIANGQTTFFLQFPIWWAYAASFAAAAGAAIVAIYCAAARIIESVTDRPVLPPAGETDH